MGEGNIYAFIPFKLKRKHKVNLKDVIKRRDAFPTFKEKCVLYIEFTCFVYQQEMAQMPL